MAAELEAGTGPRAPTPVQARVANRGDRLFRWAVTALALVILVLVVGIFLKLLESSWPAMNAFGLSFLWDTTWDPVFREFGALPFIYGTIVSSLLALLIGGPISLGAAVFLAELAPYWLRNPLSFLVELLAAIPSVVYGLWGIFVMVPWIRSTVQPFLSGTLGFLPLFTGPAYGFGLMAGGLILAIMIIPTITAVSRDVMRAVPDSQREAMIALGATRWETIRTAVVPYAGSGIFGATILGLGRALGETMAITMVIGNRPDISASLFSPAYTMSAVIANEFAEATYDLYLSVLIETGAGALRRDSAAQRSRALAGVAGCTGSKRGAMTMKPARNYAVRRVSNFVMLALAAASTAIAVGFLFSVLGYVLIQGGSALNLEFFTGLPRPVGQPGGGMGNAIVGTLILLAIASAVALPIGIGAGVYLSEYGHGRLGTAIRFTTDVLTGVPSIVVGIFVYTLLVLPLRSFSALAGGVALAIIMLPTVTRATEEMLKLVPARSERRRLRWASQPGRRC